MRALNSLRFGIIISCFFNLLLALTHWAGIANNRLLVTSNYGLSALVTGLVLCNAIVLTHHPEIALNQRQSVWLLNFAALLIAFLTEWL
ncbi:membrane protein [Lactiplantibacillus plantarum EGD-AQ4]|nr:membrane protein [Lactiplantibacillus plantarum EGD-AQ4]